MPALTIHEAATTTGWSPRMLRYVEQLGLVEAPRSAAGYRLYGPAQLPRLRTLRALLDTHDLELGDVGRRPAAAPRAGAGQRRSTSGSRACPTAPVRPRSRRRPAPDDDWLAFEQDKHQQLLTSDRRDTA